MRYLSVCSGIEAATVAWHPLGWTPVAFSEIEPFPAAVLAHHYPTVPNYGDMTKHKEWPLEPGSIDLLVGGTPCQSFSVAGLRKGISDPRGGLMLTYLEIAQRLRPRWIVWENVPGVLSSGGGRDFGSFLGALGELGYGWAYRVLDAQWCRTHGHPRAVPQRRRRVFVVGCLGNATRAAAVLFERESVQRDSAPRRAQGQGVAADAEAGVGAGCVTSHDVAPCLETTCHDYSRADGFTMVGQPTWPAEVAPTLNQSARGTGAPGYSDQELFSQGAGNLVPQPVPIQDGREMQKAQNGIGIGQQGDPAYTLDTTGAQAIAQPVPYDLFQITAPVNRQNRKPGDPCHTLARDNAAHAAVAFANRTRDGIKVPEVMADGIVPALTNPGDGGRSDAINVAVTYGMTTYETPKFAEEVQPTLTVPSPTGGGQPPAVATAMQVQWASGGGQIENNTAQALRSNAEYNYQFARIAMTVRRLTPRECERLQAFPDDYTLIPWRKKPATECPDGPRYKALGNSMACNCMAWIGERIAAVEARHD